MIAQKAMSNGLLRPPCYHLFYMRLLAVTLAIGLAAAAEAQVHLTVRGDGTKVISNIGAAKKLSDYGWLAKQRNRRSQYDRIIERHSAQFGVDPILVRAVIQVESDFNPRCISRRGARGLMQLMPETARYSETPMNATTSGFTRRTLRRRVRSPATYS